MDEDRRALQRIEHERGGIASIHSAFRDLPGMISGHYDFYQKLLLQEDLPLSRGIREFLAVLTSRNNECFYCYNHHRIALEKHRPDLSQEAQDVLKELVDSMNKEPWNSHQLKNRFLQHFSEKQWLHAIAVISYFNMANRLSHALELKTEDNIKDLCR